MEAIPSCWKYPNIYGFHIFLPQITWTYYSNIQKRKQKKTRNDWPLTFNNLITHSLCFCRRARTINNQEFGQYILSSTDPAFSFSATCCLAIRSLSCWSCCRSSSSSCRRVLVCWSSWAIWCRLSSFSRICLSKLAFSSV